MNFVQLCSFENHTEAHIVLKMLQASHIRCHLKAGQLVSNDPVIHAAMGGLKLMVAPEHIEKAWDLLDQAEQAYLKNLACPICKAHALTNVRITRNHRCKLAALASMLLNGHSVEIDRLYQCKACGYDFKKLPAHG